MGGEPTFVSVDDMEGAEWTIDADGDGQARLAWDARPAAWPTRSRPARCSTTARASGTPASRSPAGRSASTGGPTACPVVAARPAWRPPTNRVARRRPRPSTARTRWPTARRAGRLRPSRVRGPARRAAGGGRLPRGTARRRRRPDRPATRDRSGPCRGARRARSGWARRRGHGAHRVGHAAPPPADEGRWMGHARWTLRRGRLVLVPGDSPVGLRLPLDALTWTPAPPEHERSPFESANVCRCPTPGRSRRGPGRRRRGRGRAAHRAVRRAARRPHQRVPAAGRPPRGRRRAAGVVEAAVTEAEVPVVVEGYPPPRDDRHRALVVTPDPGVIEVNVHPASSWPELAETTEVLYDAAKASRLGTEKFELDGTHSGTGGGNHLTLGGADPRRQPAAAPARPAAQPGHLLAAPPVAVLPVLRPLRRPDQPGAPGRRGSPRRARRARDRVRASSTSSGDDVSPWLVDRLFRHLLVDLTGNTHRAEFCIDKLFTPELERGRLGLLELRGFEMPPHPQMALVQALLVRSLVARCGTTPTRPASCGGAPSCTTGSCCPTRSPPTSRRSSTTSSGHGIAFELSWLDPFLEFRFPRLGTVEVEGVRIELRGAIEPWLVLGEEVSLNATARYVDSSVERLQVRVEGVAPERHVVTCNGRVVPLRPTSTPGHVGRRRALPGVAAAVGAAPDDRRALAAGVRRDRPGAGRSLGGCTYHVTHPGGRTYDRSRSTPTRPRPAGRAGSPPRATPPAPSTSRSWRPSWSGSTGTLGPWTCGGPRHGHLGLPPPLPPDLRPTAVP